MTFEDTMIPCGAEKEFICPQTYVPMWVSLETLKYCTAATQERFEATRERNLILTSKFPEREGN